MQLELHQLDQRYAALRIHAMGRHQQLVASLREHGQHSPVTVVPLDPEPGRYVLIDGYRRVAALGELGEDLVEALVWPVSEAEALVLSHKASRRRPTALEDGWLLVELGRTHGLSRRELCLRMDRSASWVSRRLSLVTTLPASVQEAVRRGQLSPQAAMKHLVPLSRDNRAQCETLMKSLGRTKLSVREVGRLYDGWKRADDEGRSRIVQEPLLFLEATDPTSTTCATKAATLLLRDAQLLERVSARAARKVTDGALDDIDDERTRTLERHLRAASRFIEAVREPLGLHHARQRDPSRHSPSRA